MRVTPFSCGPAVNESELNAFKQLESRLRATPGDGTWILLTNLAFSVTNQLQSDEIDIVAIGPPGVRVIEVKHWSGQWVDVHADLVAQEADRATNKARKIGTMGWSRGRQPRPSRKVVIDTGRQGLEFCSRTSGGSLFSRRFTDSLSVAVIQ